MNDKIKIKKNQKLITWKVYSSCFEQYGVMTRKHLSKYYKKGIVFIRADKYVRCKHCNKIFTEQEIKNYHNKYGSDYEYTNDYEFVVHTVDVLNDKSLCICGNMERIGNESYKYQKVKGMFEKLNLL